VHPLFLPCFLVGLLVLSLLFLYYLSNYDYTTASGSFHVLVDFSQVSALVMYINLDISNVVGSITALSIDLFAGSNGSYNSNVGGQSTCLAKLPPLAKELGGLMMLAAIFVSASAACLLHTAYCVCRRRAVHVADYFSLMWRMTSYSCVLLYQTCFKFLSCASISGQSVMSSSTSIQCFSGPHLPIAITLTLMSVAFLAGYIYR
jgi:hypothetical protein